MRHEALMGTLREEGDELVFAVPGRAGTEVGVRLLRPGATLADFNYFGNTTTCSAVGVKTKSTRYNRNGLPTLIPRG